MAEEKDKIVFVAQPRGHKLSELGEVDIKLRTSSKYLGQALALGILCDGETLFKVTIEPYKAATIGSGKRKPAEKVDTD